MIKCESWVDLLSNKGLRFTTKWNVVREHESIRPIDNLPVSVMCLFGAERRPTNQTFEHDCSYRPPIAAERITLSAKDLRRNVIRGPHRRVGHDTARFAPGVDLPAVADCEVDLVQGNRVSVTRLTRRTLEKLLVVRILMLCVKTSGETEIGEFDVSTTI